MKELEQPKNNNELYYLKKIGKKYMIKLPYHPNLKQ